MLSPFHHTGILSIGLQLPTHRQLPSFSHEPQEQSLKKPKRKLQEAKQKWRPGDRPIPRGAAGPPVAWRGCRGKMSPWALAVWLPLHLLLLWLPGCCLMRCPSRVMGTEGEILSLQCWYEEKYKTYSKYWCKRTSRLPVCADTVKTKGSDREASRGQVSIHDHPENLTFTVTLKNSSLEDTGSYWCGIRIPWLEGWDDIFVVEVSVRPAYSSKNNMTSMEHPTQGTPPLYTWPSTTREATPGPSPQPGSLLSSIHFVVLVFLELPLLLSMLSAVLWVNRPLRRPRREAD